MKGFRPSLARYRGELSSPEAARKPRSAPREFMFAPVSPSIRHFLLISKNLLHIRAGY